MKQNKQPLAVHKNYWIRILKDPSDGRELKMQFAKDVGFTCPLEAASYLENAPQEWFVGSEFVTTAEMEKQ